MFTNYLKLAFRSLLRHKATSFINVVGLSIGISASLVIYLIVYHEFSFDKFHRDGDRIYRVVSMMEFPDMTMHNSGVPMPTPEAIQGEITGIASSTHFLTSEDTKVTVEMAGQGSPRVFRKQKGIVYVDTGYFRMFDYRWLAGSPAEALTRPFSVVLTRSRAQSYFPNIALADLISRKITYEDSIAVTITGIVEDLDEITDFTFQEFVSIATVEQTFLKTHWDWKNWGSINSASQFFIKLVPGVAPKNIEEQLVQLRNSHRENNGKKDDTRHNLQPLADIHFNPDYDAFENPQAYKPTLYGLLAVAAFLLFLGCINFINLATAQASQRAKEIGIRKTLGSGKSQLVLQFLGESSLLTLLAAALSIALAQALLDLFQDFIPAGVTFASIFQPHVLLFLAGLVLLVSLLSGVYPALVLTRFQPIEILRNQAFAGNSTTRNTWLRKVLTVAQFSIAQFLIIATIVVSKQILFSVNKDLGYRRDAIVSFNVPWAFVRGQWVGSSPQSDTRRFMLTNRLREVPGILNVSLAGSSPASTSTSSSSMKVNTGTRLIETTVELKQADTNYFNLFGMKLVAGRNLLPSDTAKEFVINETYAKFLGFSRPEDALGHLVEGQRKLPIVGVLADFHTKSTHLAIKPLLFQTYARWSFTIHLALNPGDPSSWKTTLGNVETIFKEVYPDGDFNPKFFDQTINAFYKTEQNTARLLNWAAGLAIFISCLGLLGLVIHTTNARTKEIGVRKVLGASASGIVALLSKEFLSLVVVAFVISAPVGWWAMNGWLEDFAYRTSLSWWVFALSGVLAILTALLTVSVQAFKAASANPVDSLRTE